MKSKQFLLMSLLLVSLSALSNDHLQPESGPFTDDGDSVYKTAVRDTLLKGQDRTVQMVTLASFQVEEAIYILREESKPPMIVSNRVSGASIWSLIMDQIKADAKDPNSYSIGPEAMATAWKKVVPKLDERKAQISKVTADLLIEVWGEALTQVRYINDKKMTFDGTTYYFGNRKDGFGTRGGHTWSPASGTKMASLVSLGKNLKRYVDSEEGVTRSTIEKAIKTDAQKLLKRLKGH